MRWEGISGHVYNSRRVYACYVKQVRAWLRNCAPCRSADAKVRDIKSVHTNVEKKTS